MSGLVEPPKRRLIADTDTPATEIVLSDGLGRVVERAGGRLSADVEPGLYKLRFRVGDQIKDELVELPEGTEPFIFTTPRLPFETAAPITRLGRPPSPNAAHAVALSQSEPTAHGDGSQLLIFVDTPGEDVPPALEVRRFGGDLVAQVAQGSADEPFAGGLFNLDPGNYLLRCGQVEQTIVTCLGWQTQVYLRSSEDGAPPDLPDAAILMSRTGAIFNPDNPGFRAAEVARRALKFQRWRAAEDPSLAPILLSEKFDNPILGILAAHLMLLADPVDISQLQTIAANMERLIPGHPDVVSLFYVMADPRAAGMRFDNPPMLRSSWQQIIKNESEGKVAVSPGSYAARIAADLWGDGAWLTWTVPAEAAAGLPIGNVPAQKDLLQLLTLIRGGLSVEMLNGLTPAERVLLGYAQGVLGQLDWARMLTRVSDESSRFSALMPLLRRMVSSPLQQSVKKVVDAAQNSEALVKVTGLPMASIGSAAESLSRKLGAEQSVGISSWINAIPGAVRTAAGSLGFGGGAARRGLDV